MTDPFDIPRSSHLPHLQDDGTFFASHPQNSISKLSLSVATSPHGDRGADWPWNSHAVGCVAYFDVDASLVRPTSNVQPQPRSGRYRPTFQDKREAFSPIVLVHPRALHFTTFQGLRMGCWRLFRSGSLILFNYTANKTMRAYSRKMVACLSSSVNNRLAVRG